MDPQYGERKILIDDFYKISTNLYILLKPRCRISTHITPKSLNKTLIKNLNKQSFMILIIILINFLFLMSSIIQSFYISILLKQFSISICFIFMFNLLVSNYSLYLIRNKINKLSKDISYNLITNFYDHVFRLPLKYIHIKDSNEIIKRVLDLDSIKELSLSFIIHLITNSLVLIIVSIILVHIDIRLLFVILFMIIGYLFIIYILNRNISNDLDLIINEETNYNNSLIDYINGMTSIKHSSSEEYFKNDLSNKYSNNNEIKYRYTKYLSLIDFLKQSFINMIQFVLNIFLIYQIIQNKMSLTDLIVIDYLFQLMINSLITIGDHIPGLLYQKRIISKVNDFYSVKEEENKLKKLEVNNITVNDLSFSYNGLKNVINNVNVRINKNGKIILKGESGCGKSTLCKILNKEYDKYEGNIYLGNINYNNIDIKSIRNIISYSSQNEVLFHGTIKDNILMGHKISDDNLNKIVDICELNRIIKKKSYGLDTYLYGGGSELSGGERQLIILARSLVLNKPILILDETLSEVNDKVEDIVLNKLFKYYKDKMIIYVSHKNKKNYFYKTLYV